MNAIDMKGSRHALDVKTGEAVWNPHVDEVLGGIVHAVGPNYSRKPTDDEYFRY